MSFACAIAVLLAGALIGATGIGGVLVVPALTQLEGMALPDAVAASSLAFAFPALAGLWWLRSGPTVGTGRLWALVAGAAPGAVLGGLLVHRVDAAWLMTGLAMLAIGSGARGLFPARATGAEVPGLQGLPMAAIGLIVGFGSALTGTGGPVILIPVLMFLGQPFALTMAAAQAIQLPVALSATAAHVASGSHNLLMAGSVGLILLAGSLAGQRLAGKVNGRALQVLVCVLLLLTGLWFAWKAAH